MELPQRLPDGTPFIRPSQVRELLTCAKRFEFRHVQGVPEESTEEMQLGTAVHAALEWGMRNFDDANLDAIEARGLEAGRRIIPRKEDTVLEDLAERAAGLAGMAWADFCSKGYRPLKVEQRVVKAMEKDWAVSGTLDLLASTPEGKVALLDWKVSGRMPDYGVAPRGYVFSCNVYGECLEASGQKVDEVWLVYVLRTKEPKVFWCPVPFTPETRAWALTLVRSAKDLVDRNHFPMNPFSHLCKPSFCQYWSRCIGASPAEVVP